MTKHSVYASPRPNQSDHRLTAIAVLIIVSSARAGSLVRQLFENLGIRNVYLVHTTREAVEFLRQIKVHLIVTDADLEIVSEYATAGGTTAVTNMNSMMLYGIHFVHRLRYSPASPAPFVPVLMLMDKASSDAVSQARDAGVSEIILRPLEAFNFCNRLVQMIDNPRPFITAENYRGPCRRRRDGAPPAGIEERRVRDVRLVRCEEMQDIRT